MIRCFMLMLEPDRLQVAVLERMAGAGACSGSGGPMRDVAVQQRPGGRLRAWVLGSDGVVCALDDAPVSRGVSGACTQLLGDAERGLASVGDAQLQLQVMGLRCAHG